MVIKLTDVINDRVVTEVKQPPVRYADAVFEGGGVKGLGLVGALVYAEEVGFSWNRVAGTSAGAIVACLVAAGYRAQEIKDLLMELDYKQFKDPWLYNIPVVSKVFSLFLAQGLYRGAKVEGWLRNLLANKGVKTFGDLKQQGREVDGDAPLRIIASDLSRGRMMVLPDDLVDYGYEPEKFDIAKAVRMSISIPYFYQPVKLPYAQQGKPLVSYVVDGGLLSNYPIWLFDSRDNPRWPTFGFRLVEPGYQNTLEHHIYGPISLFGAMVSTMMEAHDARFIEKSNFARTIPVPTCGVKVTDFELSLQQREALFNSGYTAAKNFYSRWRWQDYLEAHPRFRRGT